LGDSAIKDSDKKKKEKQEIDFTQFTMDDIARKVLNTPPKPKQVKKINR
jgi:hypothetical protein